MSTTPEGTAIAVPEPTPGEPFRNYVFRVSQRLPGLAYGQLIGAAGDRCLQPLFGGAFYFRRPRVRGGGPSAARHVSAFVGCGATAGEVIDGLVARERCPGGLPRAALGCAVRPCILPGRHSRLPAEAQ
jgi:hypothetical protein